MFRVKVDNPCPLTDFHEIMKDKDYDWDQANETGDYINLIEYPEIYTGYQGQKVWDAIFENSFQGSMMELSPEERLLNRLLLGWQSNVDTQISEHYVDLKNNQIVPDVSMFFERVGNYPDRILNIYFTYSVLLRAINRSKDLIKNYPFNTSDFQSDVETHNLIESFYETTTRTCFYPFNESALFQDKTKEDMKKQILLRFQNISSITDCVKCDRCNLFAKVVIEGLRNAFTILFNDDDDDIQISRNQLVALINTFHKFSSSLQIIDKMFERKHDQDFIIMNNNDASQTNDTFNYTFLTV